MSGEEVKNRWRAIFDQAPQAMICFDRELRITESNQAANLLLGMTSAAISERRLAEFFSDAADQGTILSNAIRQGECWYGLDSQARKGNGTLFPVRMGLAPLSDGSGQEEMILCFSRLTGVNIEDTPEIEALRKHEEIQQRADLLNAIADGEISDREVAIQRAQALGMDLTSRYAVFAINIDDCAGKSYKELQKDQHGMKNLLTQVTNICSSEQDKIVWTRYDGFAVLCPLPDACADSKGHSLTRAKSGKERVTRQMPEVKLTVGVSSNYSDVLDIRRCYREAKEAANVGRRVWGGNDVYHYADLGICQLLTQFQDSEQLQGFVDQSLGKLIEYDKQRKTQLLATLEEILSAPNLKEAAERSFVHHKTILSRKVKIEEVLGVSIDNVEIRLTLSTAMKILRLLSH